MFKESLAFSSFAVVDIDKAKQFYGGTLGLEVVEMADMPMPLLSLKLATGGMVMIYPKEDHVPATYTILNFPVSNIDESVDALIESGVTFEQYDNDFIKTDDKGISRGNEYGPSMAWFKDPSDNILAIMEEHDQ